MFQKGHFSVLLADSFLIGRRVDLEDLIGVELLKTLDANNHSVVKEPKVPQK